MKKKVMIISNVSRGLYNFRRELIEELVKSCEVLILASDTGETEKFKALGVKFIETKFERHGTNPLKEVKLIRLYKNIIREVSPDIVLTYTIKQNIYAGFACASLNIPYIANITGLGPAVENPGLLQKITVFLYRKGLKKAQIVFFQNKMNMDFMLQRKMVSGRYGLIPGSGVNLNRYPLLEYPNGKTIDFVFISRLIKEKGTDQYLEAAEYIREKYPNTRFHICGKNTPEYEARIADLGRRGIIIYHGLVNDIAGIHAISACTIHPTYYPEGMSNVLLESCSCGRPIITTDRPGCGEIVDDGVNGFVVKAKDSQDLIKQIEKFLALSTSERKAMGLAGRRKVEEKFSRNIVVDKYLAEING